MRICASSVVDEFLGKVVVHGLAALQLRSVKVAHLETLHIYPYRLLDGRFQELGDLAEILIEAVHELI